MECCFTDGSAIRFLHTEQAGAYSVSASISSGAFFLTQDNYNLASRVKWSCGITARAADFGTITKACRIMRTKLCPQALQTEADKRELGAGERNLLSSRSVRFMANSWQNKQHFYYIRRLPCQQIRRELIRLRIGVNPLCKQRVKFI